MPNIRHNRNKHRNNEIEFIQNTLSKVGIVIKKDDDHLNGLHTKKLVILNKCLEYLFKNYCLTEDNVNVLFETLDKKIFSIPLISSILKKMSDETLLNQENFDKIFNNSNIISEVKSEVKIAWRNMIKTLVEKNLLTQNNLNNILNHRDFINLLKVICVFSPTLRDIDSYQVITQDFLDKLISQDNLSRFKYLLKYVSDSTWINNKYLTSMLNKLIQCNKKLGQHEIIKENRKQMDYSDIEQAHLDRILDKCNSALTPQAAADVFNHEEPIPLSFEIKFAEVIKESKQQNNNTSLQRIKRDINTPNQLLSSPFLIQDGTSSLQVTPNNSVNIHMLLDNTNNFLTSLNYTLSMLAGIKNDSASIPIESANQIYKNRINAIAEEVSKVIKVYEEGHFTNETGKPSQYDHG